MFVGRRACGTHGGSGAGPSWRAPALVRRPGPAGWPRQRRSSGLDSAFSSMTGSGCVSFEDAAGQAPDRRRRAPTRCRAPAGKFGPSHRRGGRLRTGRVSTRASSIVAFAITSVRAPGAPGNFRDRWQLRPRCLWLIPFAAPPRHADRRHAHRDLVRRTRGAALERGPASS
jgi:hypothetical protein